MALRMSFGQLPSILPAKTPFAIKLITPPYLLHSSSSSSSSSYISTKSISSKIFTYPLRASPLQKCTYPDPIPEFAEAEARKFRGEISKKLSKEKETFGDDFDTVIEVCVEVFSDFLNKGYGGPGTLLVEPFTDMLIALKERKLPGAPLAARTSLLWAQNNVDLDWETWISNPPN